MPRSREINQSIALPKQADRVSNVPSFVPEGDHETQAIAFAKASNEVDPNFDENEILANLDRHAKGAIHKEAIFVEKDLIRMYLKEIGTMPLLTREQEIVLGMKKDIGAAVAKDAQERIESSDDPKETNRAIEDREIGREEELKAKHLLTQSNLRLVVSIAKHYTGNGLSFLDLIQEGNLGLMRAVDKWDYSQGFRFTTYGSWWIKQAVTRSIADKGKIIRIPTHTGEAVARLEKAKQNLLQKLGRQPEHKEIAEVLGMTPEQYARITHAKDIGKVESMDEPFQDGYTNDLDNRYHYIPSTDPSFDPVEVSTEHERTNRIEDTLQTLTDREKKVIELRYGLHGKTHTLQEVGDLFDVSRERIRQIEAKALKKLRSTHNRMKLSDLYDE